MATSEVECSEINLAAMSNEGVGVAEMFIDFFQMLSVDARGTCERIDRPFKVELFAILVLNWLRLPATAS